MAAPWMAAPMATHRSGSTSPRGCVPNASTRRRRISGVRVAPPTSRISSTCEEVRPADAGVRVVRKLLLSIFRAAQHACHRLRPVGDVNAVLEFDVLKHVLDDLVVEIVAAELIVAVA